MKKITNFSLLIIIFFLLSIDLNANDTRKLVFTGVVDRSFSLNGLNYKINSRKKTIDYQKLRKLKLFNRKKILSQAQYYNNGSFYQKNIKTDFSRGFFYDGEFHMQDAFTNIDGGYIKAESAIAKKNSVEYKKLFMNKDGKKYRKRKYTLKIE